jgi:hypothetical protein
MSSRTIQSLSGAAALSGTDKFVVGQGVSNTLVAATFSQIITYLQANYTDSSFGNGTVGAPSIAFLSDPDTGIYRISANHFGITAGGTLVADFAAANVSITGAVNATGAVTANGGFLAGGVTLGTDTNGQIELGGQSKVPFIDFHSSSSFNDWDVRIQASGGSGVDGAGILSIASGGVVLDNPTGGGKGTGTLNAKAVYDDNVLLTDMVGEYTETGKFDLARWDATVPDRVTAARVSKKPAMQTITVKQAQKTEGGFVLADVTHQVPVTELMPVWDQAGNGIDAIKMDVIDEVEVPESTEVRTHGAARAFKELLDQGLEPKSPESYVAKLKERRALPGMPNEAEWEHSKFSIGEIHTRHVLAVEILAASFATLVERVAKLETA